MLLGLYEAEPWWGWSSGSTLLSVAACQGAAPEVVKRMLATHEELARQPTEKPEQEDGCNWHELPLHLAAREGHVDICRLLLDACMIVTRQGPFAKARITTMAFRQDSAVQP